MEVCYDCAGKTLAPLAEDRCLHCDGKVTEGRCRNPLCNRPEEERGWDYIWAISTRTGSLKSAISRYKYDDKYGWARIFGRVLVGFLNAEPSFFESFGLIIPSPTYVGPGGRSWDHTGLVIERAAIEGPYWPFRIDVMTKTSATTPFVGLRFRERAIVAEQELRPALRVRKPRLVKDRHVLVYDDVFTGGLTLREVAFKLRAAGALSVSGIVLARQPYGG
jgi:predicted amidophosphoribosyltransferase